MISPYEDEHISFLDSLVFEIYDDQTRNLIYDFYEKHNVTVWLSRQLRENNCLEYIIEFDYDWFKVYFKQAKFSIWKIN